MNTKNNRRSQSTDEKIIKAFYNTMLEEKKPVARITVSELCRKTGINRSTFYAHYSDVYDILEKVEKRMSDMLTESFIQKLETSGNIGECFEGMFAFIKEYQEFYRIFLNETDRISAIGITWDLLSERREGMTTGSSALSRRRR